MKENLLFWMLLAAFLLFDNLIVVARGKDYLNVNRSGNIYYKYRQRNTFAGRDVLFLNPFNLFDRVSMVEFLTLKENKHHYKSELRSIKSFARDLNSFAYLGYLYFFYLVVNCYISILFGFESVVINLIVGHVLVWFFCVVFVLLLLKNQYLPKGGLISALFEALFVPAYLINLNKKLLRLKYSEISSLRLHIRRLKRVSLNDSELIRYELLNQANTALDDEADPYKNEVLKRFVKCLKI